MTNLAMNRTKCLESKIIQGGMGAGVSNYGLVREVCKNEALGVVSGVALNEIMVRRLQQGDFSGEIRNALKQFPDSETAEWIVDEFFIDGGKKPDQRYKSSPFPRFRAEDNLLVLDDDNLEKLIVAANFVEVTLAKQGHNNPVGINYLYKIQWPLLPAIYGAMLAGVDALLIGAGFFRDSKKVLKDFSLGNKTSMPIPVIGREGYSIEFTPENVLKTCPELDIPLFIGVVGNHLGVKALPDADCYVFENYTAGGHNAPARERGLTDKGEPKFGDKDDLDPGKMWHLLRQNAEKRGGIVQPYWLAGGYSNKLKQVLELGAVGVQVGTPFAFCQESGIEPQLKMKIIEQILNGATVFTSPCASPSGFPFKVLLSPDTISDPRIYGSRSRVCDLGYLSELCTNGDGVYTRCPAEKIDSFSRKGGEPRDIEGRVCLCNGLVTTIGLGSPGEMPIVTSGSDLTSVKDLVNRHGRYYYARNVIDYIYDPK